jgi:hypothetical protein
LVRPFDAVVVLDQLGFANEVRDARVVNIPPSLEQTRDTNHEVA